MEMLPLQLAILLAPADGEVDEGIVFSSAS
jgi:hypothetical protein